MRMPVLSPERIVMMEDHDAAYRAWKERDVRGGTLVHVDAHIDFGWIPDVDFDEIGREGLINPFLTPRKKMMHIGNYICPAMKDGIVDRFYWVVPDESWQSGRGRKEIMRHLAHITKIKRYAEGPVVIGKDRITCRVFGKEVIVCGLEGLGCVDERVLLDIDVDFMITRSIWDDLNPVRVPWIMPEELFTRLMSKISGIDVLTIAYSVEGGFTPLKYKYLGDQLRTLFEDGPPEDGKEKGQSDASLFFNLSLSYLNGAPGGTEKAAFFLKEAIRLDRTYSTRYNNYGTLFLRYNKPKEAKAEYRKFLRIDPDNASVFNGLGHIALDRRRYREAEEFFDRCLAVDKNYPEARLGKAIACFKTDKLDIAEELLSGLKNDRPDDAETYWWFGRVAHRRGDIPRAIGHYKDAVMRGWEDWRIHAILARLYVVKGFYFRAVEEMQRSFRLLRNRS